MEIKIKKVHTTKDLIISVIIIIAGIGLYFLNAGLGGLFAVCGLLMLLFYKVGYKREGENVVLRKKSLDISHNCRTSLKEFLEGKDVDPEVTTNGSGLIIGLEAYYNAKEGIAYVQLFDYSNFEYEAATGIVELRGPRAELLISKI